MAMKGQKFSLDLDADNFTFDVPDPTFSREQPGVDSVITDIKEREALAPPPPPKSKSKTGFPSPRPRKNASFFKQRQADQNISRVPSSSTAPHTPEPSDRAIANHIGRRHGFDTEATDKAQISEENKNKLANMSLDEIEAARAELLSNLNPSLVQRLLKRANIEEDQHDYDGTNSTARQTSSTEPLGQAQARASQGPNDISFLPAHKQTDNHVESYGGNVSSQDDSSSALINSTIHFPVPPRDTDNFVELDPNSESFLADLKTHYFPSLPHDPSALSWLQDPSEEEVRSSPYGSDRTAYAASDIRFDFTGRLIPPSESETISVDQGLHHHGDAPGSAGYTIPELAMLCRSTLPNQRCMAYQTTGRILYRLGRGDFGPRGAELSEGLWACVEKERPVEVMMVEANRLGGHISAKTHATEALWLWRKGGGGDRGVLKGTERVVR